MDLEMSLKPSMAAPCTSASSSGDAACTAMTLSCKATATTAEMAAITATAAAAVNAVYKKQLTAHRACSNAQAAMSERD